MCHLFCKNPLKNFQNHQKSKDADTNRTFTFGAANDASHLDDGLASNDLQDLPAPLGAVRQSQVNDLSISGELEREDH